VVGENLLIRAPSRRGFGRFGWWREGAVRTSGRRVPHRAAIRACLHHGPQGNRRVLVSKEESGGSEILGWSIKR
jgi:hypothetical protein